MLAPTHVPDSHSCAEPALHLADGQGNEVAHG